MKYLIGTLLVLSALGLGYVVGTHRGAPEQPAPTRAQAKKTYVCPMHSNIVRDRPGTCPICGMDLVATEESSDGNVQIHVDSAVQQKMGVRTATAAVTTLTQDIKTYGTIVPDETKSYRVTPNIDGVLAKLYVQEAGQHIPKGKLIYELSSTDALNLQYEYIDTILRSGPTLKMVADRRAINQRAIEAAQSPETRAQAEHDAHNSEEQLRAILQPLERDLARNVLRLGQIGFTDAMIHQLERTKKTLPTFPVHARDDCVVKEVMARPGMTIMSTMDIFTCVNTNQAWLEITLYPDQLSWVRAGDRVTIATSAGERFSLPLTGLDGILDATTRTVRARLPLPPNKRNRLGEYVDVTIHAAPRQMLAVPQSAVIRTGHGNYVMRALEHHHFMPVKVSTGMESDEQIAIRDGLQAGDEVVVNGQFLLDAAASIADTAQRMQPAAAH